MQQISWEVIEIYPLKIYEIRYCSFFLSVKLHVSYVCFMKLAPGLEPWTCGVQIHYTICSPTAASYINVESDFKTKALM